MTLARHIHETPRSYTQCLSVQPVLHTPPGAAAAAASSYVVIPAPSMTELTVSRNKREPPRHPRGSPPRFEHLPCVFLFLCSFVPGAVEHVDTRDEEGRQY